MNNFKNLFSQNQEPEQQSFFPNPFSSNSSNSSNSNDPSNILSSIIGDSDDEWSFGKLFKLSLKQRLYGFVGSGGIGILFALIGCISLFFLKFSIFGVTYSIGNICMILSTMFIVGPVRQFKMMLKPTRIICSIIFLITIALTLMAALWWKNAVLSIIFVIIQTAAFVWYCMSYIPGSQKLLCGCLSEIV